MLREFYDNFTTRISPFYKEVIISVKRDNIVLITPNIEQAERMLAEFDSACERIGLELSLTKSMFMKNVPLSRIPCVVWNGKTWERYAHHLCFADNIVLITPNIEQAERMLAEFDSACERIGLELSLTKSMFMKNGLVPDAVMHKFIEVHR
uniref:Reverse transcriptase domain-containing protein n=1 Tax=Haemonchus contortus TaxID=6289 RepID=A0A7I4Z3N6_HAECO